MDEPNLYRNDLMPLNDMINIIFGDKVESEIDKLFINYKETFLNNESSRLEFDQLLKANSLIVFKYLSNSYIRFSLGKYFSKEGIIFLIITTLAIKAKLYYTELLQDSK
jgi:hypothetical protein